MSADQPHFPCASRSVDRIAAEIPRLDKRKRTILYCKVGVRSMYAAQQLADAVSPMYEALPAASALDRRGRPTMARYS